MPFVLPQGGNRIATVAGRIRTALAVSERERGVPAITPPRIGAEYLFISGQLYRDGIPQPRSPS